jgi:hypothetical protein
VPTDRGFRAIKIARLELIVTQTSLESTVLHGVLEKIRGEMKITFLGHSAVYIETKDHKIVIDPFIAGNPVCPVGVDDLNRIS